MKTYRFIQIFSDFYEFVSNNSGFRFIIQFASFGMLLTILVTVCREREDFIPPSRPIEYDPDDYFVPNEIILTGTRDAIDRAINAVEEAGSSLQNIREISIAFPDNFSYCPGVPYTLKQGSGDSESNEAFLVALVRLSDGSTLEFNEALSLFQQQDGVTAELNLVTGSPDYPTGSTSGWPTEPAEPAHYIQWAFNNIDIEPSVQSDGGRETRIVIFDTVPTAYPRPESAVGEESAQSPSLFSNLQDPITVTIPNETTWILPISTLRPDLEGSLSLPETVVAEGETVKDLSSHGLFVAQMAHAAAPNAQIELVEVLNEQAIGNMYTLILAFYEKLLASEESRPTVANLSLGIHVPPPAATEQFELPEVSIEVFHTLIQLAYCQDIVVVAAAGNNSETSFPPELADLPADWSSVISVAASNKDNQRSCFSNHGDIAAPGGDGRLPQGPIPGDPPPLGCESRLSECDDGNCPFGIVGPVYNDSDIELVFWNGSSFSSPLVAGLAARVLSESTFELSPDDVRHIIECGATDANFPNDISGRPDRHIGEGVINVNRTLSICMPPP